MSGIGVGRIIFFSFLVSVGMKRPYGGFENVEIRTYAYVLSDWVDFGEGRNLRFHRDM